MPPPMSVSTFASRLPSRSSLVEQVVDRLLRLLADDVPERLLDAGRCAVEFQRAAPLGVIVERHLQDVTDMEWIASDQIAAELRNLRRDRGVPVVLAVGFAPPDQTGVGLDTNEHKVLSPACIHWKTFNARNFHGNSLRCLEIDP
jgi:hypothetical protein